MLTRKIYDRIVFKIPEHQHHSKLDRACRAFVTAVAEESAEMEYVYPLERCGVTAFGAV